MSKYYGIQIRIFKERFFEQNKYFAKRGEWDTLSIRIIKSKQTIFYWLYQVYKKHKRTIGDFKQNSENNKDQPKKRIINNWNTKTIPSLFFILPTIIHSFKNYSLFF